jgi:hypothetical protein
VGCGVLRRAAAQASGQVCKFPELLGGGSEKEFVSSARRASHPEPIEAQDALEMRDSISIFFRSRRDVT